MEINLKGQSSYHDLAGFCLFLRIAFFYGGLYYATFTDIIIRSQGLFQDKREIWIVSTTEQFSELPPVSPATIWELELVRC